MSVIDYLKSDTRGVITGCLASAAGNCAVSYFLTRNSSPALYIIPAAVGAATYPASEITRGFSDSWSPTFRAFLLSGLNGGYGYWLSGGDPVVVGMFATIPTLVFQGLNYWRTGEFP